MIGLTSKQAKNYVSGIRNGNLGIMVTIHDNKYVMARINVARIFADGRKGIWRLELCDGDTKGYVSFLANDDDGSTFDEVKEKISSKVAEIKE